MGIYTLFVIIITKCDYLIRLLKLYLNEQELLENVVVREMYLHILLVWGSAQLLAPDTWVFLDRSNYGSIPWVFAEVIWFSVRRFRGGKSHHHTSYTFGLFLWYSCISVIIFFFKYLKSSWFWKIWFWHFRTRFSIRINRKNHQLKVK